MTKNINIEFLPTVTSTNDYLKKKALSGANEGTVVVAHSQTAGKGRRGRSFISSVGGLYLSILIRPDFKNFDITLITSATAVAVCEAIEAVNDKKADIKWVNDVFLDGKKACGILCEAAFSENSQADFVVVGIGINLFEPKGGFDAEIKDIATAVFDKENPELQKKMTDLVIKNFFKYYYSLSQKQFINAYRQRNFVLGKQVNIIRNNTTSIATALEIDDNCRLLVKYNDGKEEYLSSAEVSIRI